MLTYLNDALTRCEQLLKEPNAADWLNTCYTVGNILSGMGYGEAAYNWRAMALEDEPNRVRFYAESEFIYRQCEAWPKAIYACQQLLDQEPTNPEAQYRLATAYGQLGDRQGEAQALYKLFDLETVDADADKYYRLARALHNQGKPEDAMKCYQMAVAKDAQSPEHNPAIYYSFSHILAQQNRWQEVITLMQQMLTHVPQAAQAHEQLGRAYRAQRQSDLAIFHFREAIALDSQSQWGYMGLLNTLMELQRWDEAIETCNAIAHDVEDIAWVYCFMGNAFFRKGDASQAAAYHQQAFSQRGWPRALTQDYRFGLTWFNESIPLWQEVLATLPANEPIMALELGSSDASSTCWLVDQILSHERSRLVCFAPAFNQVFEQNLAKLPERHKVTQKIQDMSALSGLLAKNPAKMVFDVMHLQCELDASGKPGSLLQSLATHAWPYLKPGGIMIVKDYQWHHPNDPQESLRSGFQRFIAPLGGQVEILHQTHQAIIRKRNIDEAS
jgi:tetratricopeptide (TPR) repeat protein